MMMVSSALKTTVEVKFTHILNFKDAYKAILAPFIRLGPFNINNPDTIQESIVLSLPEEKAAIEVRWDRMIYTCDGRGANLFTSNGPMLIFFQILKSLKDISSFGEITTVALWEWFLLEENLPDDQIIKSFKNKYLNKTVPVLAKYDCNDVDIQMDMQKGDSSIRLQFGPYQPQDIQALQLSPAAELANWSSKHGILCHILVVEKSNAVDTEFLSAMDQNVKTIVEQLNTDDK